MDIGFRACSPLKPGLLYATAAATIRMAVYGVLQSPQAGASLCNPDTGPLFRRAKSLQSPQAGASLCNHRYPTRLLPYVASCSPLKPGLLYATHSAQPRPDCRSLSCSPLKPGLLYATPALVRARDR